MPEYRQFAYCNVLGLYCSQINNLISTGSNSLWHCTLLMDPPALENQPLCSCNFLSWQQSKATAHVGISGDLNLQLWSLPNAQRRLVCLVLLSNTPQAMPASLHGLQQFEDQSQICTSHHHDGQLCSVSCLFSLKNFVPQETPTGTVILGSFFHWLPWGLKEACKGRLTLPFPYYSAAERFATISFYLITSLSFQLVTAYDASSWSNYLRHNKTYLI